MNEKDKRSKRQRVLEQYFIDQNLLGHFYLMMSKDHQKGLPDVTPRSLDKVIIEFKSKLCCGVNAIAIVHEQRICFDCFNDLRARYTGSRWDIT